MGFSDVSMREDMSALMGTNAKILGPRLYGSHCH
jgi:hypothetical protein